MTADRKYEVEITANTSKFENALASAGRAATATSNKIDSAFGNLRGALNSNVSKLLAGLGAIGGASAFAGLIKGSIDAADHLNDLSKSTGIAVDTLGGIGFAAQQSGSDLDETAKAVQRLNIKIAEATAGNEQAQKAFRLVGISVDELKKSTTSDVLARLADKFRGYEGDANKAALGTEFFKKSYSGIAPLLDDGGDKLRENIDYFKQYGGVTQEVADKADQFNDTMVKLKLINGQFARALASELLPSLQTLADRFIETKEKGAEFQQFAGDVSAVIRGITAATIYGTTQLVAYGRAFGAIGAQAKALVTGDFAGVREIQDGIEREQEERFRRMNALIDAINNPNAAKAAKRPSSPGGTGNAPSLGSSDASAALRKEFDQQIKELEDRARTEADIYRTREVFLKQVFDDDLISVKEWSDTRQRFLDDAFAGQAAAYRQAIAIAEDYAAKANPKDRLDAEGRVADLQAKLAKAQSEYSIASVNNFRDQTKAAQAFRDKIEEIAIALAEARGDTVDAGLAAFDKANAQFAQQAKAQADSLDAEERRVGQIAQEQLAARRDRVAQQLQLNRAQEDFGLVLQKVSNAQGMLDAERAAGNLTELEFLSKLSNLNAGAISDLRQRAEIYESISNSIGGAAGEKARVQAEALRVEVARLAAGTNLVGREFEKIAESAFADFLTDVATGAKTAKEAFLDMEKAIVASVSRIAAQNLAEKLFGGSASGGTTTGNNWLDLLLSIGLRFLGVNTGGGLGYGTAGSVIPPGPYPYANGTAFHPGGWAMVGERGPELLQLPRGSAVVPNHQLAKMGGSSVTVHQTINVQGTVDGRTARQIAREAALSLNTAMSRG